MKSGLSQPKDGHFGSDFTRVVKAVSKSDSNFIVGDEVFNWDHGEVAQVAIFTERQLALKT